MIADTFQEGGLIDLLCARRTSTFLSGAFREQEDDQATLPIVFSSARC